MLNFSIGEELEQREICKSLFSTPKENPSRFFPPALRPGPRWFFFFFYISFFRFQSCAHIHASCHVPGSSLFAAFPTSHTLPHSDLPPPSLSDTAVRWCAVTAVNTGSSRVRIRVTQIRCLPRLSPPRLGGSSSQPLFSLSCKSARHTVRRPVIFFSTGSAVFCISRVFQLHPDNVF